MSSLDDFFAKKDRKKSATKTNLLAADELYRTLEETTKAPQEVESTEKLQLEVVNSSHATLEFGIRFSDETIDEEDEWCDFTEEHDQPFPNLKRNSKLILTPVAVAVASEEVKLTAENACQYQDTGGDGLGVGQTTDDLSKATCPWLKLDSTELANFSPRPVEAVEPQLEAVNSTGEVDNVPKKQVYVPPALRQSQSEFNVRPRKQPSPVAVKLSKGQAPDLNNVEFFPSLCKSRLSKRAK